jgi:chromosome segregation ATPase
MIFERIKKGLTNSRERDEELNRQVFLRNPDLGVDFAQAIDTHRTAVEALANVEHEVHEKKRAHREEQKNIQSDRNSFLMKAGEMQSVLETLNASKEEKQAAWHEATEKLKQAYHSRSQKNIDVAKAEYDRLHSDLLAAQKTYGDKLSEYSVFLKNAPK